MTPSKQVRALVVIGTRPEAVKLAPLILVLRKDPRFQVLVITTGQHDQLVKQEFDSFGIVPDDTLRLGRRGQSLTQLMSRALPRLSDLYGTFDPDVVIVQGDTTSAVCASLAAFQREPRYHVAHVEAGLRTLDRLNPYPEEVNRRILTSLADWHFAPTSRARRHLIREGVGASSILVAGNTIVDAVRIAAVRGRYTRGKKEPYVLVTLHRREAWARLDRGPDARRPLEQMLVALRTAAERNPSVRFVYIVHPNPRVRELADRTLSDVVNVELREPIPSYFEFLAFMRGALFIVTDSGGIQEEAFSLGQRALVLRETTERTETMGAAANVRVGTEPGAIARAVEKWLRRGKTGRLGAQCRSWRIRANELGDGRAAERIRDGLLHFCTGGRRPRDYQPPAIRSNDRRRRTSH